MLKPDGDNHSNRSIIIVAACMATIPTNIQDAVSNGSGNEMKLARMKIFTRFDF